MQALTSGSSTDPCECKARQLLFIIVFGSFFPPPLSHEPVWSRTSTHTNARTLLHFPSLVYQQILGNNECFEPYTSNIYVRRVLSGEFTVVNQHLLHDLNRLGLWNPAIKNELVGVTRVGAEGAELTCSADCDCPSLWDPAIKSELAWYSMQGRGRPCHVVHLQKGQGRNKKPANTLS